MSVQSNTAPRFTKQTNNQSVAITAGNTSSEGGGTVGTSIFLAFTPGANDSFVEKILLMPTASAAATTTTATVVRVFRSTVNTGTTTSANTFLIAEQTLPAVSADNSTNPVNPVEIPINFPIGGSNGNQEYLLITNHSAPAASTQWVATTIAADY